MNIEEARLTVQRKVSQATILVLGLVGRRSLSQIMSSWNDTVPLYMLYSIQARKYV